MKLIMVAGVARSGTSMTMGVLEQLGIPVPGKQDDNTGNALVFNPWGSFESRKFDFFLQEGNSYLTQFVERGISPPENVLVALRAKYKTLIEDTIAEMEKEAGGGDGWWAFKANGNACLDFLMPYVNHVIVVTRSIVDNAKSYQVLVEHNAKLSNHPGQIELDRSIMECSMSQYMMIQTIWRYKHKLKTFISYENLKANPIEIVSHIANDIKVPFGVKERENVAQFIQKNFSTWKNFGDRGEYKPCF